MQAALDAKCHIKDAVPTLLGGPVQLGENQASENCLFCVVLNLNSVDTLCV